MIAKFIRRLTMPIRVADTFIEWQRLHRNIGKDPYRKIIICIQVCASVCYTFRSCLLARKRGAELFLWFTLKTQSMCLTIAYNVKKELGPSNDISHFINDLPVQCFYAGVSIAIAVSSKIYVRFSLFQFHHFWAKRFRYFWVQNFLSIICLLSFSLTHSPFLCLPFKSTLFGSMFTWILFFFSHFGILLYVYFALSHLHTKIYSKSNKIWLRF